MSEELINGLRRYCDEKNNVSKMLSEWIVGEREQSQDFCNCICGKEIKELCSIIHKRTNQIFQIGNHCIIHFESNGICPECSIYEIDSPTHHKCKNCRAMKTRPTFRIKCGKYKGELYEKVWRDNQSYCEWAMKVGFFDEHFVNYCMRQYYLKNRKHYEI